MVFGLRETIEFLARSRKQVRGLEEVPSLELIPHCVSVHSFGIWYCSLGLKFFSIVGVGFSLFVGVYFLYVLVYFQL